MAGLGDLLEKLLIRESTYKRVPSIKQVINQAYARGGRTWRGAAKWLGVSESTLRRWRTGSTPSGPKIEELRQKAAEVRRRRLRKPIPDPKVARIQWFFDGRDRDYPIKNLQLAANTLKEVQDHLILGDPDTAGRAFLEGITDPWYKIHFTAYEAADRVQRAVAEAGPAYLGGTGPDDDYDDIGLDPHDIEDHYEDLTGEDITAEEFQAILDNQEYAFTVGGFK